MVPPKVWQAVCLLFIVNSLATLWFFERYEVTYVAVDDQKLKSTDELLCVDLKELYPNKIEIQLEQLGELLREKFQKWIRSNEFGRGYHYNVEAKKLLSRRIETKDYFVLLGFLCFAAEMFERHFLSELLETKTTDFVVQKETFDMLQINDWFSDEIAELTVLNTPYPYSDCSEIKQSRFQCLNECFKSNFRLSRYFYHSNETGSIQLNHNEGNRSIEEGERSCFKQCKKENCKLINILVHDQMEPTLIEFYRSRPVLGGFDFWVQFIGCSSLFLAINLHQQMQSLVKFVYSKVKRSQTSRSEWLVKLNWSIMLNWTVRFISLIIFLSLSIRSILDFQEQVDLPARKENTKKAIEPEILHLVICVPFGRFLNDPDGNELVDNLYYAQRSLQELENESQALLNATLDSMYLSFLNRTTQIGYCVQPKVLFRYTGVGLQRCFQVAVHPVEPRYQQLLSISKLKVKFKTTNYYLFLVSKNEEFNVNSFFYGGQWAFRKSLIRRSRLNRKCLDNALAYTRLACTSRQSCVERCINRLSVDEHQNITIHSIFFAYIIDRDQFTAEEWTAAHLNWNKSLYDEIKSKCEEAIPVIEACVEVKYTYGPYLDQQSKSKEFTGLYVTEIELYVETTTSVEEEPDWYSLMLDILSIQSIIFGMTVLKMLKMIYYFSQTRLKVKENKFVLFFIYLLCSVGFSWQTYRIFDLSINGELSTSQFYMAEKRVPMREIIFCFDYDFASSIDDNHQMTGNYLEELSGDLTVEKVFESITYLDERSNRWAAYNLSLVEPFYFASEKCFKIKIDQVYEKDQFHFSVDSQVLKVNFIKSLIRKKIVYFISKTKSKTEFSVIANLDFRDDLASRINRLFQVRQESLVIKQEDRFHTLKRPLSLFRSEIDVNDASAYLSRLLRNYRAICQSVTLNLALNKKLFHEEIRDDLFDQLYRQIQNVSDRSASSNLNYERQYSINHIRKLSGTSHFSFGFVWFKKVVVTTNQINPSKLLLNLLNVLSIWFNMNVLDLHIFLSKIRYIFVFSHNTLLKFKRFLYRAL